ALPAAAQRLVAAERSGQGRGPQRAGRGPRRRHGGSVVSARARRRQGRGRGERGQALLFALLALLIASMAAAFLAEDLALREKALQEEAARFHVRALLDGALADALARLADRRPLESGE